MSDSLPSFGTAGIRAPMGPGRSQMNEALVRRCTAALVATARKHLPDAATRGICIGYDGRHLSSEFALCAARTAAATGLAVHLFDSPVPTPLVAFTARRKRCACAMVITASHNPPQYNGMKVYWDGGAQIVPPFDAEVAERMGRLEPESLPVEPALPMLKAGDAEAQQYLEAIRNLSLQPGRMRGLRIAYSAMHGVGSALTHALLGEDHTIYEVASQARPDPALGGMPSPNPEHPAAMQDVMRLGELHGVDLVLAHDPDADRLAAAIPTPEGQLRALSGDEVGALLGHYLLEQGPASPPPALLSTVVSGSLLSEICKAAGAHYETTLTGFRWIASRGRELEREGFAFRFGYEEAIGYALGALGDDKDGLAAAFLLVEQACFERDRGSTLLARLQSLYRQHGLYRTGQRAWTLTGEHGARRIADSMRRLRGAPPATLLGRTVTHYEDWSTRPEGANLIVLRAAPDVRVAVRPSGTEPKLKAYLEWRGTLPANEEFAACEEAADRQLQVLAQEVSSLLGLPAS